MGSALYYLTFGPYFDKRILRKNEERLASDVRDYFNFLFTEHGAKIIPNDPPTELIMDLAHVTLAMDDLQVLVRRVRGETYLFVARRSAPKDWQELSTLLYAMDTPGWKRSESALAQLSTLAGVFKTHLPQIREALTGPANAELKSRLDEIADRDREAAQRWSDRINAALCGRR